MFECSNYHEFFRKSVHQGGREPHTPLVGSYSLVKGIGNIKEFLVSSLNEHTMQAELNPVL